MRYVDLQKPGADLEGAAVVLGRIASVSAGVLGLVSDADGSFHGFKVDGLDGPGTIEPGRYAVLYELGGAWSVFGAYDEYAMALNGVRGAMAVRGRFDPEPAKPERSVERARHEDALAKGEPAATRTEAQAIARAQSELAADAAEPEAPAKSSKKVSKA